VRGLTSIFGERSVWAVWLLLDYEEE